MSGSEPETVVKVSCFASKNPSLLCPMAGEMWYFDTTSATTLRISSNASRFPTHA